MAVITPTQPIPMPPAGWSAPIARPAPAGITGADIVRILRQRIFLIIGIWLLGIAITVGVTSVMQVYFPLYAAEALVQVTSLQAQNPMDPLNVALSRPEDVERLLQDQSMLAMSTDVIRGTLEDPRVTETTWYAEAKRDTSRDIVDALKEAVTVTPVRHSSLLRVGAETRIPQDAPALANALSDKYIGVADTLSKQHYQGEQSSLEIRRNALKQQMLTQKSKINEHLAQYPFVTSLAVGGRTPVDEDVLTFNNLKNDFHTQALNYQTQWENLRRSGTQGIAVNEEILAMAEQDPLIVQYRQQISASEQFRNSLLQSYGPKHRRVLEVEANIADIKEKLESARADATNRYLVQQREYAGQQYSAAEKTFTSLSESYEEALAKQADQQDKLKTYRELISEYEAMQKSMDELSKSSSQLEAVINRTRTVQITNAATAQVPKRRSRPNWYVWLPMGTGLSLLLAFGLAMLLEYTDTSVRTARDVRRHADMSVLGVIPHADDDEVDIGKIEMATLSFPSSMTAEAFRNMRTNLFFAAPAEQQGTLLITSASPGEGKTTVAINLAAAIAMSGRRVLLIDANFRRPSIRNFFPTTRAEGLTNILIGQGRLADLVGTTQLTGLDVLTSGPIPPNPAELLGGKYLRDMLGEARSRYDQIIFDGPPALLVSDAMVLSGVVDGVIMVCRFRQTSRGALQRARDQLNGATARVLGAALNAVQTTRGGYFREQYRAFYEYQPETPGEIARLPGQEPGGPKSNT